MRDMRLRMLVVVAVALVMPACGGSSGDSADGYSPEHRATQLAREAYRWDGETPPEDLSCQYSRTESGGAEWYICGPDGMNIGM